MGRAAARLVPAERRDWAQALWAEAHQVPPGLARLAWRAGGVRLIAREALMARRIGIPLLFAAAAAWVAWAAWPGPADNAATAVARLDVVTVVLAAGRAAAAGAAVPRAGQHQPVARVLRFGGYAAVLVLTVAKASVEQVVDNPAAVPHLPHGGVLAPAGTGMHIYWIIESLFLLTMAFMWLSSLR